MAPKTFASLVQINLLEQAVVLVGSAFCISWREDFAAGASILLVPKYNQTKLAV